MIRRLTLGTLVRVNADDDDFFTLDVIGGMPVLGSEAPKDVMLKVRKERVRELFPHPQEGIEFKVIKWKRNEAIEIVKTND